MLLAGAVGLLVGLLAGFALRGRPIYTSSGK